MKTRNPWIMNVGTSVGEIHAMAQRLKWVRRMDPVKLQRVIRWPTTQKTVRAAARSRLRKLNRLLALYPARHGAELLPIP